MFDVDDENNDYNYTSMMDYVNTNTLYEMFMVEHNAIGEKFNK